MAKGVLAGSFWGLIVGGVGTVATHFLAAPVSVAPADIDVVAPQAQTAAPVVDGDAPSRPQDPSSPAVAGQTPALGNAPAADAEEITTSPQADTQSAARPTTTATAPDLEGDAPTAPPVGVEVQVEAPVLPNPQALAPPAPEAEELASAEGAADPVEAPEIGTAASETDNMQQDDSSAAAPLEDVADPADASVSESQDAAVEAPEVASDDAAPAIDDGTEPETIAPETATSQEPVAPTVPQSGTIGNLAQGVTTNRLPSIGDAAEADQPAENQPAAQTQSEQTGRAIDDYAVTVEIDPTKPLMTIVLIDDGSVQVGPEALQSFPYPITFAVDAGLANATELMTRYRDAGYEVLALLDTPEGTQPSDLEVAVEASLAAVPQAVGLFEASDRTVQTNANLRGQMVDIAASRGLGLLSYQAGLNPLQRDAVRADVPAGVVFRDLDGKGQDAGAIRRFLDQAAFKAAQEGGVIMVGRVKPDTISALLIWGLGQRAARVSLVPVSALLTAR